MPLASLTREVLPSGRSGSLPPELTSRIEADLGGIGAPRIEAATAAVLRHFVLRADGRSLASEVTARTQRAGGQLEFELRHALPDSGVLDIESTFFELAGIEHHYCGPVRARRQDRYIQSRDRPTEPPGRPAPAGRELAVFGAAVLGVVAVALILKRVAQAFALARVPR